MSERKRLTPEREAEIRRDHELTEPGFDSPHLHQWVCTDQLLAELDAVREELKDARAALSSARGTGGAAGATWCAECGKATP